MKHQWIKQQGHNELIVFFNGWGMGASAISHLQGEFDIIMMYDYRDLLIDTEVNFKRYSKCYLIAWSMGVWAASRYLKDHSTDFDLKIAINGTDNPIHPDWGIPPRIYNLTERTMGEEGRQLFIRRMMPTHSSQVDVNYLLSDRSLNEVCEELCFIKKQWDGTAHNVSWNYVIIGDEDVIFSAVNQRNWCEAYGIKYHMQSGGHYLFANLTSWNELITSI